MLDIIRKKASAWMTKIIFGIIIVVFVFFFGYSRMSGRSGGGGGGIVAKVNGSVISRSEYQMAYDNTLKMYQSIFKTEEGKSLPEGIEKSVRSTALNQLIQQKVIEKLGNKMDLVPSNIELAETIRKSPVAKGEDGQFDPLFYKLRFLPYFSQKYSMDYEDVVRSDLVAQNVQQVFASMIGAPSAREQYNLEKTKWSFSVTEFDNEDAAKAGKGGKSKNVGPINISERSQLFPAADMELAKWENVFKSSAEPVKSGEKWYKVKVTKIDIPTDAQWEKDRADFERTVSKTVEQETFQTWVSALMKNAKVKTFIQE